MSNARSRDDVFTITFPPNVDVRTKALFLASVFGINWLKFRKDENNRESGYGDGAYYGDYD